MPYYMSFLFLLLVQPDFIVYQKVWPRSVYLVCGYPNLPSTGPAPSKWPPHHMLYISAEQVLVAVTLSMSVVFEMLLDHAVLTKMPIDLCKPISCTQGHVQEKFGKVCFLNLCLSELSWVSSQELLCSWSV